MKKNNIYQTYGIYVTYATGTGIRYTNGTGTNQSYSDANMSIALGKGGGYWSCTINPRVWNGRIFYRVGSGGGAGCPSAVKAVTVNVGAMPLYNAGVTEIVTPVGAVTQGSTHTVKVAFKNYASDTLKKVTIGYSVNGVVKTPFVWTGILLYSYTIQVNIGSETFQEEFILSRHGHLYQMIA